MNIPTAVLVLTVLAAVPAASESFGHGLGGDVAPPLDLGGRDVTVSTQLVPADLSVRDASEAAMAVRFFDVDEDESFKNVTYRIEIWQGEDLIARSLFFDEDGTLNVDLRTKAGCAELELWMCTKYYGSEHPTAPGALYAQGESNVIIQGPIFDRGGLYNVKVDITGATSARTVLASPLSYDTFVSVADVQPFTIRTAHAEVQATIKTYYDTVSNIEYDDKRESLSFEMPFDWDPDYIDLVQIVHEEVQVPKSFTTYSPDRKYAGYVDGVRLDKRILIVDPYTYKDRNVIHFLVTTAELQRINAELGSEHEQSKIMRFELVPEDNVQKNTTEFDLVDPEDLTRRIGATVSVSWEAGAPAGVLPLEIAFFDESGGLLRDSHYGYVLADHLTGTEILRSLGDQDAGDVLGNLATEGIDTISFEAQEGAYRLDVVVYGQGTMGLDFDSTYFGIGSGIIEVGPSAPPAPATPAAPAPSETGGAAEGEPGKGASIPKWIRNSAGLWADGTVGDVEFVSALEFLIERGVIVVSAGPDAGAGGDAPIPSWIKRTTGAWAQGVVGDADFVSGLEFLIQKGIISVGGAQ